jgi:deazaflavin-dependent oxidoreductase (nitroreductase family)
MSDPNDMNVGLIKEFRANAGVVGGYFEGKPVLLLHHTGAKSGTVRVNPLMYNVDGDNLVIFASKAGAPSHPDWYRNLLANPKTQVEVGADTLDVTVREAKGEERDRLWDRQKAEYPQFADYEKSTDRVIPVLILERS